MDIDHNAGGHVEGWPAVAQSIFTILTTRIGSRVFRRDFGSRLPELIDAPMNDAGRLAVYVAVADALDRWERRFILQRVSMIGHHDGRARMELIGLYVPRGHLGVSDVQLPVSLIANVQSSSIEYAGDYTPIVTNQPEHVEIGDVQSASSSNGAGAGRIRSIDQFTADGAQNVFILTADPIGAVRVFVGAVTLQQEDVARDGRAVSLSFVPDQGLKIEIDYDRGADAH